MADRCQSICFIVMKSKLIVGFELNKAFSVRYTPFLFQCRTQSKVVVFLGLLLHKHDYVLHKSEFTAILAYLWYARF